MLVGGWHPVGSAHKGEGEDPHMAHDSRSAEDGAPLGVSCLHRQERLAGRLPTESSTSAVTTRSTDVADLPLWMARRLGQQAAAGDRGLQAAPTKAEVRGHVGGRRARVKALAQRFRNPVNVTVEVLPSKVPYLAPLPVAPA